MKKLKLVALIITMVGLMVFGGWLYSKYGETTTIVVERTISTLGDVENIIKKNPDIEQMVKDEARKREIREALMKLQADQEKLVAELTELETKGFTQTATLKEN